ncbi:MAG TPA: type II toxin-antitoxin system HicB family antitoxin [Micromonosporaceae bacterium]|nr:type II toxin-antitoxin system HicB family antitoxin [Micromonosporaceae bacterium]
MNAYAVIIEQSESGTFGAWSPDLPGCVAVGETAEECVAEMREAIKGHLELLAERGEPAPVSAAVGVDLIEAA